MAGRNANSLETILTSDNRDFSQWSEEWSTTQVPGMDTASGRPRRRAAGRRQLRFGSLALAGLLTMHCRVAASALTGGLFVFLLFLVTAVAALASPMRHFEVYLGQWSISGPGRAFRIVPMLDGIGIAICMNAIIRAINCCFIAAIASLYVMHSVSDAELPFTYCRDFNLKPYTPKLKEVMMLRLQESRFSMEAGMFISEEEHKNNIISTTVGLTHNGWRNHSSGDKEAARSISKPDLIPHHLAVCNEKYSGNYPVLYTTPAYNFFYVEIVNLRDDYSIGHFNTSLIVSNVLIWSLIWAVIILERFRYGKLIWNNTMLWILVIPVIWALVLSTAAISSLVEMKTFRKVFRIGAKELLAPLCHSLYALLTNPGLFLAVAIADALEVALYIHSAAVGTEIIHGKGLNHYASGHIDPYLDKENVWHSVLVLLMSGLHCVASALCALVDSTHMKTSNTSDMAESTLWIMPMYSKCSSLGNYSHMMTTVIFGGLVFSYVGVAFILIKTALHTIFEYRVKLIFVDHVIVGVLIITCMGLSLPFASNGGIALLESVDAMMSGIAIVLVCMLELFAMLYVYRPRDFLSDMNLSQEDSACPTRVDWQWRMIPFVTLVTIFLKTLKLARAEMPHKLMYYALAPVLCVLAAVPLRAIHNAIVFMRPRHGT